ncbi:MAG: alpha-amylase family glycosyl hydrolase [Candidatus Xenobia bacterium]
MLSSISRLAGWLWGGLPPGPPAADVEAPADQVLLGTAVAAPPPKPSAPLPPVNAKDRTWQDEIIYFAMTDRFADGDKSNDQKVDLKNPEGFHGGDWQGLINHLDKLADLGVTTLWISPVTQNDEEFDGKAGYHGYWPHDFRKPEPHFGDMAKLQELVEKAHQKGIKVLIDVVLNHTGYNHPWTRDPSKYPWFHHNGVGEVEGSLWGLPDLAQENPDVAHYLIDTSKWWADQTKADGFRLDAVKHMPKDFEKQFADSLHQKEGNNFFLVGEVYDYSTQTVASYEKDAHMDAMFDYPLANVLRNVVGYEKLGFFARRAAYNRLHISFPGEASRIMHQPKPSGQQFHDVFANDNLYLSPNLTTTLIENHDMPRFMSVAGKNAREKYQLALLLQFAFRGIPTVYYGAEDGMGMTVEDMRADKRDGADPGMRQYIKDLTAMRRDNIALRRGEQKELSYDDDTYAFARVCPEQTIFCATNFSGSDQTRDFPLPDVGAAKVKLRNVLNGEVIETDGKSVRLHMAPDSAGVYEVLKQ